MKMKKTLAFIAAMAMLGVTGMTASAEEAVAATETEIAADEVTADEVTAEAEEAVEDVTEETTEAVEDTAEEGTETEETTEINEEESDIESSSEDTSIVEGELALPVITEGKTFKIGDTTFTAEVIKDDFYPWVLKIYNDNGLVYSKEVYNFPPTVSSIKLAVDGTTIIIKECDSSNRMLYEYYIEYNTNTGSFGQQTDAASDTMSFEFAGNSFVAVKTKEFKTRYNEKFDAEEYDEYDYLSIYFADGTATSIQNKLVWVEYGKTGGFGGYGIIPHIEIKGDKLIIRQITDQDTASKDVLTTYVFDEEKNDFVQASTSGGSSNSGSSAGSSGTVSNSPATSDSMSIPAVAASAIVVLGSVIYVSKKRK
ncbi:MAG: hypothetical protein ACI4JN_04700 [Ruminococcus sp.]